MNDKIFYLGSLVLIGGFVILIYVRFKKDDNIDIKKHWFIILIYTLFLITSIVLWRYITITISKHTISIHKYNNSIQKIING